MDKHILEEYFITLVDQREPSKALDYLDQYPVLIDDPTVKTATYISALLLMCEEIESCIQFSEIQIKKIPSADLHYNLAYAYELSDQVLLAIKNYQCARLFSTDASFHDEVQIKILTLKYPEIDPDTMDALILYNQSVREYIQAQLMHPGENIEITDYIKSKPPVTKPEPSILFGTMEIANHISHYIKYFRTNNYDVLGLNYVPSYLNYNCDFSQALSLLSPDQIQLHYLLNAIDLINDYDVFHFVFNQTLLPGNLDLILLKKLGKKVFMHNLGSEIRIPDIARKHHPYWRHAEDYLGMLNGLQIEKNIQGLSSWIDNCIVNDYEMRSYIEKYYKNVFMLPLPIDLSHYQFTPQKRSDTIHIVHAPTNRSVKGSVFFENAIKALSQKYPIRYTRIENLPHEEAMKYYKEADIVLDELIIGTYGSLTIECLAMGRCVATFIHPGFKTPHADEIPVWSVNVDNLMERLEMLINSYELRCSLSLKGREYVEKHNDYNAVGAELIKIYMS